MDKRERSYICLYISIMFHVELFFERFIMILLYRWWKILYDIYNDRFFNVNFAHGLIKYIIFDIKFYWFQILDLICIILIVISNTSLFLLLF